MKEKRNEPAYLDATLQFRAEVTAAVNQLIPIVKSSDSLNSDIIQRFASREVTHARFLMPAKFTGGTITELVIAAIQNSIRVDDIAYSLHGAEHLVFSEAGSKIIRHLVENPEKISASKADDLYESPNGEKLIIEKYLLETPWKERKMSRPLYYEVAIQLNTYLAELQKKYPKMDSQILDKKRKELIVSIAKWAGFDFAILVCLCCGLDSNQTLQLFTDVNLPGHPTKSRQSDFYTIFDAEQSLRPDHGKNLTFDRRYQDAASEIVRNNPSFGHAHDDFWTDYTSWPLASSLAVLGGANYMVARLVDEKTPDFRNPAKSRFVAEFDGYATTKVITMYNRYKYSDTELIKEIQKSSKNN